MQPIRLLQEFSDECYDYLSEVFHLNSSDYQPPAYQFPPFGDVLKEIKARAEFKRKRESPSDLTRIFTLFNTHCRPHYHHSYHRATIPIFPSSEEEFRKMIEAELKTRWNQSFADFYWAHGSKEKLLAGIAAETAHAQRAVARGYAYRPTNMDKIIVAAQTLEKEHDEKFGWISLVQLEYVQQASLRAKRFDTICSKLAGQGKELRTIFDVSEVFDPVGQQEASRHFERTEYAFEPSIPTPASVVALGNMRNDPNMTNFAEAELQTVMYQIPGINIYQRYIQNPEGFRKAYLERKLIYWNPTSIAAEFEQWPT